ncbi:DNA internalization-related competence protein ComEC/Rec2 [Hydromonas duriensis]|uniref:Competence protein ComEC n=1 Tax=Hydromonas duriensis TaxID=1527608 RepID=A0A4R6Y603_9BURK|nr:DNA internalization-related competence protein ComEC/Rec2 [Hydromonas duriensis]TDR29083.1 competence protein ComEC [Hydromonas duriensis]
MHGQWRLFLLTVCMVASLTAAHQCAELLPKVALWGLVIVAGLTGLCAFKFKTLRLFFVVMMMLSLTVVYTQIQAWQRLHEHVLSTWIGQTFYVQGVIDSIPTRTPFGVRFIFKPTAVQSDALLQQAYDEGQLPSRISTAWYDDDLPVTGIDGLRVGQVWALPLTLKPTHATQNPDVYDQEQDWFARNVRALATVRLNQSTPKDMYPRWLRTETSFWHVLQNTRATALQRIDQSLAGETGESTALFKALTLGEQNAISNTQWALFQKTGVTHLVSISGVHVTMLAMVLAWLTQALWRRSVRLCAWLPSLHAAQYVGLLVAFCYALLAGWGLPAQCTVLMLALWLLLSRLGVASSGVRVLCFALWVVLLSDVFAVFSMGFWLSFGAVAWLILALGERKSGDDSTDGSSTSDKSAWILKFIGTQIAIGLALLPVTLYFFHQASFLGVAVNIVAIPLVTGVVTPVLLSACLLSFMFGWAWPMLWAHALLDVCLQYLNWLAQAFPQAIWWHSLTWWQAVLLSVMSIGLLLQLRQRRWWRVAALSMGFIVLLFSPVNRVVIPYGQVRVHVFDIGQGSAVLLQTASQNWLFDAGPRYGENSDAGVRLIVPYLRSIDVNRLDMMVLSHNDTDHTGGAASVSQAVEVSQLVGAMSAEQMAALGVHSASKDFCLTGQSWAVDGVRFSILNPSLETLMDNTLANNPKSCVLRVDASAGQMKSMLLTGDIDGLQEARLLVSPQGGVWDWQVDVLMMPHHGSRHSSTAPLLEATKPKWAIAQAGFLNSFHHPAPNIVERYQTAGAQVFNTAETGALRFCLGCVTANLDIWRITGRRYWWDDALKRVNN